MIRFYPSLEKVHEILSEAPFVAGRYSGQSITRKAIKNVEPLLEQHTP